MKEKIFKIRYNDTFDCTRNIIKKALLRYFDPTNCDDLTVEVEELDPKND